MVPFALYGLEGLTKKARGGRETGSSAAFDEAVAGFAMDYAPQSDRDHKALAEAVEEGRIKAVRIS